MAPSSNGYRNKKRLSFLSGSERSEEVSVTERSEVGNRDRFSKTYCPKKGGEVKYT
jgi:hypothetical protein